MVGPDRSQTEYNTAHALCTTGNYATSEHAIHTTFPLQQWLSERASMLRYTFCILHIT